MHMSAMGQVYLVGAGPGDPEYLTLKAHRLLQNADVLVYDRLISPEILKMVAPGTMRISVGKAPGHHIMVQEDINALLVTLASAGLIVVRLKGGDPFIFGRGSEEAIHLTQAGVPYDVVPGITSAQGCSASTRIPLTHRGVASSVRYITGHCKYDEELDFDWDGLADSDTTLVIYMGMANIHEICRRLIAHGLSADTPAAAVSDATTTSQRLVTAPLAALGDSAHSAGFEGPVLFIVGNVVNLAASMQLECNEVIRHSMPQMV